MSTVPSGSVILVWTRSASEVPVVMVPGGGDQWELANRVQRQGSGLFVRPLTADGLAQSCRKVLADSTFKERAATAAASAAAVVDPVQVCTQTVAVHHA